MLDRTLTPQDARWYDRDQIDARHVEAHRQLDNLARVYGSLSVAAVMAMPQSERRYAAEYGVLGGGC